AATDDDHFVFGPEDHDIAHVSALMLTVTSVPIETEIIRETRSLGKQLYCREWLAMDPLHGTNVPRGTQGPRPMHSEHMFRVEQPTMPVEWLLGVLAPAHPLPPSNAPNPLSRDVGPG